VTHERALTGRAGVATVEFGGDVEKAAGKVERARAQGGIVGQ